MFPELSTSIPRPRSKFPGNPVADVPNCKPKVRVPEELYRAMKTSADPLRGPNVEEARVPPTK